MSSPGMLARRLNQCGIEFAILDDPCQRALAQLIGGELDPPPASPRTSIASIGAMRSTGSSCHAPMLCRKQALPGLIA